MLFDVYPHPFNGAHNGSRIIAAVGDRKMMRFAFEIGLPGIGDLDKVNGKIRKKILEQITPGQVLQSLMWMRNIPPDWHFFQEKGFVLDNMPDSKPGILVNSM